MPRALSRLSLVVAFGLGGCGVYEASTDSGDIGEAAPAIAAEFLSDLVLEPDTELGGLSAVLYVPDEDIWLALSDAKDEPRLFELDVDLDLDGPAGASVSVRRRIDLVGAPFGTLDPEGLALSPWGTLLVSSEADRRDAASTDQPRLLELEREGRFRSDIPVPEKFLAGPGLGVRHNLAFEALTVSPEGSRLFLGTESALAQDGPVAGLEAVGFSRIVEFEIEGERVSAGREYVYPVGPIAPAPELQEADVEAMGGLVELAALSPTRLLALERIFIRERTGSDSVTRVRLYDVGLEEASDVRTIESLSGPEPWRPVTKELVVDFDEIIPNLSPEYPMLDNYEAMGFGPPLDDGARTLLVVSDDNFRAQQRTVFLFFRLQERVR